MLKMKDGYEDFYKKFNHEIYINKLAPVYKRYAETIIKLKNECDGHGTPHKFKEINGEKLGFLGWICSWCKIHVLFTNDDQKMRYLEGFRTLDKEKLIISTEWETPQHLEYIRGK